MGEGSLVERLYFGHEDAERDLTGGLLRAGFVRTVAYDAAVSGRKMLIIGRKGSGKSAICVRLAEGGPYGEDGGHASGRVGDGGQASGRGAGGRGRDGGTALITPDDAAGGEIRRFELEGLTGDTAKSLIWRYVFAVQAARHLVAHAGPVHGRRPPPPVRALKRFLRANGEVEDDRLYNRLANGARGLQTSLSLEAFGVKAAMDVNKASEGARAARQLEVVERAVADGFAALGCAAPPPDGHAPLLLLVDQLEQVWSSDPDSHSMVIGLLLAAKHAAAAYRGAVRCLLFLRSDIYDNLTFGEGDKFHGDELRIQWTDASLRELALARARASLGDGLTAERLWGEVFPPTVEGEDTARHILRQCLPRPRDVIQYLNLCRDTAVQNGHATVTEDDVVLANRQFSEWKLQDLVKEYLVAHPYLARLPLLFENFGYVVVRSALERRMAELGETLHRDFPAYAEALTPSAVIDTLYAMSFLGVRRGADVVYTGGPQLPVQPHETEFHIHPCFRPALGCTNPAGLGSYSPQDAQQMSPYSGHRAVGALAGVMAMGLDFDLLGRLLRSCATCQRQVGRAAGLPDDTRAQILRQLTRVTDHTSQILARLRAGERVEVRPHVLGAARYFTTLAAQLRESSMDGDSTGSVVRQLEAEASVLLRAVGGSLGGTGRSAS